jgi:hypothetical protein
MAIDWASPSWSPVGNVIAIFVLMLFDYTVGSKTKARWFAVHAFANALVCLAGARAFFTTLYDPLHALDSEKYSDTSFFGTGTPWPLIIINACHLYHMIGFKLTAADYFHHLLFVPTIGFLGQVPFVQKSSNRCSYKSVY